MSEPECRVCHEPLVCPENWYEARRTRGERICIKCVKIQTREWKKSNRGAVKMQKARNREQHYRDNPETTRSKIRALRSKADYLEGLLDV